MMAKIVAKKRKRLMLGRDFDAWAWESSSGYFSTLVNPVVLSLKPLAVLGDGKWVRVKFVKVE